ncbi:hypothetical protein QA601_15665 [Chitinispirillales bacterium ANBcel5]|uniref:hypothetical protein n=1 Tax=Cellulosispirillum alkaliphilum TaxID=3039283 RepID=UPI002A522D1B|nr:hypothetical protein [Chitinispirillales bacterium ANBcel5]
MVKINAPEIFTLKYRSSYVLVLFLLVLTVTVRAQNNFGLKYFGLSIHPGGSDNAQLMSTKLDKRARFVLNIGGAFSYEHFIFGDLLSVKIIQALYTDCASQLGGYTHVGFRGRIFKRGRHLLNGGIGPTLVYRRNWMELDGYENPTIFKGNEGDMWQYLFLWYGGEFEYKFSFSKKVNFSMSFVPGYPDLMNLSLGINYKLTGE